MLDLGLRIRKHRCQLSSAVPPVLTTRSLYPLLDCSLLCLRGPLHSEARVVPPTEVEDPSPIGYRRMHPVMLSSVSNLLSKPKH